LIEQAAMEGRDTQSMSDATPSPSRQRSRRRRRDPEFVPPTPTSFVDLTKPERRWALAKGVMFTTVAWAVLITAYFITPPRFGLGGNPLFRLLVGMALLGAVIAWQAWRISNGPIPELRAVEALSTILPVFLLVFATLYRTTSHGDPHAFTQRLNHVGAMYFTITVFSTVGFGDIAPVSNSMRIMVSIQMLLDLLFIGLVVRVLFSRAKSVLNQDADSAEKG